jgi:hypothetical protein
MIHRRLFANSVCWAAFSTTLVKRYLAMHDKVNVVGFKAARIQNTGPTQPRLDPARVAVALGAEPLNVSLGKIRDHSH